MYVCVCIYATCVQMALRSEEGIGFLRAGVIAHSEQSHANAINLTLGPLRNQEPQGYRNPEHLSRGQDP